MGRPRKRALFPVALSLDSAADALQCRRKTLADAIGAGLLTAYQDPTSRRQRVLVSDLIDYIRVHWPRAQRRKKL
jgi:hypothetical protein